MSSDLIFSPTSTGRHGHLLLLGALMIVLGVPNLRGDDLSPEEAANPSQTLFTPSDTEDSFDFETDDMEGTVRLDGAYHGVSRLVDKRTGRQVIDSRYSALNLFKLMSVNQMMGQPRHMERSTASDAAWVEVSWPATESHQGEVVARYEVVGSDALDVTVTVRSSGSYAGYELFMSSYFDKELKPWVYLKPRAGDEPQLVSPMVSDVFRGTVLVFPRDAHSARPCVDGRWNRSERGAPTVQMVPVRHYGHCLAILTDPEQELGVLLMAHPDHSYAFSTRYFAENDEDRLTTYSAFDHSLFGDDLRPGDVRTVKVRLALTPLDADMSQPLEIYREFLDEFDEDSD